jgi:hypothetical protein
MVIVTILRANLFGMGIILGVGRTFVNRCQFRVKLIIAFKCFASNSLR